MILTVTPTGPKTDDVPGSAPDDEGRDGDRPAPDLFLRPEAGRFRAVALVHEYESRRTLEACLSNLVSQGLEVYVFDNGSSDGSREIAEAWIGRGVLAVEDVPRHGFYDHASLLRRKETLARRLDADWFLHVDSDELLFPPEGFATVRDALREADRSGYDAINYFEYVFVPTAEEPDHDHPRFFETMRWYYPFAPRHPHRRSGWKRQTGEIGLAASAGHLVSFEGLRTYPADFGLRHYPILSRAHGLEKYSGRKHSIEALGSGWHEWREQLKPGRLLLPPRDCLRRLEPDGMLDPSGPVDRHLFVAERSTGERPGSARSSPARAALLVLGMHRSGTSALTGCLLGLGVPLGGPLLSPVPGDNAKGYFELERVMYLHDRLLASFGATPFDLSRLPAGWERDPSTLTAREEAGRVVDSLFADTPLWALKDPRLCLLLPVWLQALVDRSVEPRYVLVLRSPWEVVGSLAKRGIAARVAMASWLVHVESAERLTRRFPRTVVVYDDLLARPIDELTRLGCELGVSWPSPPVDERSRIESFLDSHLRSWRDLRPPREAGSRLAEAFDRVHAALRECTRDAKAEALVEDAVESCHRLLADLGWEELSPVPESEGYRLEWSRAEVPGRMTCGRQYEVVASWRNLGRRALPEHRLSVSYHWFDAGDPSRVVEFDGLRTPVSRPLPPGAREELVVPVEAPAAPGSYRLELDLVRENISWFSTAGVVGPSKIIEVDVA